MEIDKRIILIETNRAKTSVSADELLNELKIKREQLFKELSKYEQLTQIYRFTKYRMGVDSISELTLEDATTTAFWWYGTLAMLVSIMGIVLAFGGFSLKYNNKD